MGGVGRMDRIDLVLAGAAFALLVAAAGWLGHTLGELRHLGAPMPEPARRVDTVELIGQVRMALSYARALLPVEEGDDELDEDLVTQRAMARVPGLDEPEDDGLLPLEGYRVVRAYAPEGSAN